MSPSNTSVPVQPIAIIGMGMRLPGGLSTGQDLWEFLINKKNARIRVPKNRYNIDGFNDGQAAVASEYGYFLDHVDLEAYDTSFFPTNKQQLQMLDPQQRLLQEVVWECLESAGATHLRGTNTGVFVGSYGEDWHHLTHHDTENVSQYRVLNADFLLSNGLSYQHDFRGPSITIRAACSASMTALHLACQALRAGDCPAAVVAGCSLMLAPYLAQDMTAQGLLAKDGICKTFSDLADGYARADGVNAILIKPLADAVRDNDPIRAVIRSTAVNADGKTTNLGVPSPMCQESMIRHAYELAGIDDVSQTAFVECHGTGTAVGDPLEMETVRRVWGGQGIYCASIKPNIGHTEGASGLTSIIKAVLSLEHEIIPPHILFGKLNSKIPFEENYLKVPLEPIPWPKDKLLRVSVNCFGIGGANSHAILDSAKSFGLRPRSGELARGHAAEAADRLHGSSPGLQKDHSFNSAGVETTSNMVEQCNRSVSVSSLPRLLLLSATCELSAKKRTTDLLDYIKTHPNESLDNFSYTLAQRRSHLSYRTFGVAYDGSDELEFSSPRKADVDNVPKMAFIFTGQGAQWSGMGKELYMLVPSFWQDIDQMDAVLQSLEQPPGWTIAGLLLSTSEEDQKKASTAECSLPLTTALQVALANLLSIYSIRPDAVAGHSSGEIAAAYTTGALTMREAIVCGYVRGLAISSNRTSGGMLFVGMSRNDVQPFLRSETWIACENSPSSVTLSGDVHSLDEVAAAIAIHDNAVFVRKVKVDQPYHSPYMAEAARLVENLLESQLEPRTASIPYYSATFGALAPANTTFGPKYWKDNIENPVLFDAAIQAMLKHFLDDSLVLVEVGPHSSLQAPIRQIIQAISTKASVATYVPTLIRENDAAESILTTIGHLHCQGVQINLAAMSAVRPVSTDLPPYPWNHVSQYWAESRLSKEWRMRKHPHHELLGTQHSIHGKETLTWRNLLRLDRVSWIRDHKIVDEIIFPGAGFIAMIGEALRQVTGSEAYKLKDVAIKAALILNDSETTEIVTNLSQEALTEQTSSSWYRISIWSIKEGSWTEHCVAQGQAAIKMPRTERLQDALPRELTNSSFYTHLNTLGVKFGPQFRLLQNITSCTRNPHAQAIIVNSKFEQNAKYSMHPTLIDALLQLSIVAGSKGLVRNIASLRVPTRIGHVYISAGKDSPLVANAIEMLDQSTTNPSYEAIASTSYSPGSQPELVAKISDVTFTALSTGDEANELGKTQNITKCEWKKDVEFCDIRDLLRPGIGTRAMKIELEKMATLSILCLVDIIRSYEITPSEGHLRKYLAWLLAEKESMLRGEYRIVPEATQWASLDVTARRLLLQSQMEVIGKLGGPYASAIADMEFSICQPENFRAILSGSVHALQLLLEGGGLTAWYNNLGLQLNASQFFTLLGHSRSNLKILELGAGTGGTTENVLNALLSKNGTRLYSQYTYTDISSGFFAEAKKRFEKFDGIEYKVLDISKDPGEQGFEAEQYDLVLASNVLHATPSLSTTLRNTRSLLRPGGRLYFQEIIEPSFTRTIPFIAGLLPGWWLGADDGRPQRANVSVGRWDQELRDAGFGGVEAVGTDDNETYQEMAHITAILPFPTTASKEVTLVYHKARTEFAVNLASSLEASGITVRWHSIGDDEIRLDDCDVISTVDLFSPYLKDVSERDFETLVAFLSNLKAGCLWLTGAAQIRSLDPSYGLIIGLARTARVELQLDFWTLELQHVDTTSVIAATSVAKKFLARERGATRTTNCEYAVHEGAIHIGRYDWSSLASEAKLHLQATDTKQIVVTKPGILDSIEWVQSATKTVQDDELEVSIRSVGMNFRDVMVAMGVLQGVSGTIGFEAAGVVTAVGSNVSNAKIGDRVITMNYGLFTTRRVLKANLVHPIPDDLTFDEAATMTLAYGTALYALMDKGGLRKGQSVLIHSACGGVGQAAIQICRMLGAQIFTTVGSEEKVACLRDRCGIPQTHIFNSRDTSFYDDVMAATAGHGVDLVLNSLSGELLHASWRCVAKWGTMLEIGKRDMVGKGHLPLDMFEHNRSFCGINLDEMFDVPEILQSLIGRVLKYYTEGHIKPLEHVDFEAHKIVDAFRYMQKGQHIGKIVISLPEDSAALPATASSTISLSSCSTYLLAGGLGGLGRSLASWMIEHGARSLLFLSPSAEKQEHVSFVEELRSQGCVVTCIAGSVAKKTDVTAAIYKAPSPVAGVVLLSGVILPRFFFVLFGSIAAITGQPGQMSYAAANTFLTSFAQYRQGLGLPCSVIEIGAVPNIGVFSKSGLQKQFQQLGMSTITESELLDAVKLTIAQSLSQKEWPAAVEGDSYSNDSILGVGLHSARSLDDPENMHATRFDVRFGLAGHIPRGEKPVLGVRSSGVKNFISSIKLDPELMEQSDTLDKLTREIGMTLCRLMIVPEDQFEPTMTLDSMGVDSLVSIEIRNWWRSVIGSDITVLEITKAKNIEKLGEMALQCLRASCARAKSAS